MKYKIPMSKARTFFDLAAAGIANSVGIGVFVLLGYLTRQVAGPPLVISIFVAALTAILAGLCFAEFQVRFLKPESLYSYSYNCHGENMSFVYGWALILQYIAGSASVAKGTIEFVDALTEEQISNFLKDIVPLNPDYGTLYLDFFSPIIILILTILLACGMKDSIVLKNILTTCFVVLLFAIIISGILKADVENWIVDTDQVKNTGGRSYIPFGLEGILKGAALSYYGFIGFESTSAKGDEMKTPQRKIPLAIQFSLYVTFFVFASIATILCLIQPYTEHNDWAALPFAFEKIDLSIFKWIIIVGAFYGFYSSLIGASFPLPQVISSMANDRLLFQFLGKTSFKCKVPLAATITGGLLAATAAAVFTFKILVSVTIFTALFISLVIIINVILLRYAPKKQIAGNATEHHHTKELCASEVDISVKTLLEHFFHFKAKAPSKLTEKLVVINLVLLCTSSIGLAVVLTFFSKYLESANIEAILPTAVFVVLILLSVASIACQPKSKDVLPFKVPLIPFIPCLSIILHILLMLPLELLPKIFFCIWMAVGILPHLFWFSLKYWQEEFGKNSVYEINRMNALKLNESIWKIKLQKKKFYEGAINPVFEDDEINETNNGTDKAKEISLVENSLEKGKEETFTSVISEKVALPNNTEQNENKVDKLENLLHLQEHSVINRESVKWECVAEIHTEEFFPESYEVQVVDNTYNFLSCIIEDSSKNETLDQKDGNSYKEAIESDDSLKKEEKIRVEDSNNSKKKGNFNNSRFRKSVRSNGQPEETLDSSKESLKGQQSLLDKPSKAEQSLKMSNKVTTKNNLNKNETVILTSFDNSSLNLKDNMTKDQRKTDDENNVVLRRPEKLIDYYHNRLLTESKTEINDDVKNFKEKLNLLLKNQINMNDTLKEAILKYRKNVEIDWEEESIKNGGSQNNIKTLNKSQMKNKLEFLLAKGPPKRFSLRNSFNIKIKETDNDEDELKNS